MNPTGGQWLGGQRAAAGAAPLAQPDRRWDLVLVGIAGYVTTVVGRVHELFAFLEPLHLTLACSALAIVLYALGRDRSRRLQPVLRSRTTRCLLALAGWMALSIPGALWAGGAFQAFVEFAKNVMMYLVLAGAARGFRDVERLAFVYLASVALYAAIVLMRFHVGEGEWRLGVLYNYDSNEFATLAVICLPLGLYFMVQSPLWRRLASLGAVAALTVAIVWAGSRGGFLALLAVGGFLLLRYTAIHARWRILTTALLAVVFAATASDTYWEKMKTILQPKDDYNLTAEEGRIKVWERGLEYMLAHPVLGVGVDNFATAEGRLSQVAAATQTGRGVKWSVAHNSFVQIGAELGVPGLILFVAMLAAAFRALRFVRWRASRLGGPAQRSPPAAQLAQALNASLVGYVVGGFFLSLAYRDLLLMLLALVIALWKVTALAAAPPVPPVPPVPPRHPLAWSS